MDIKELIESQTLTPNEEVQSQEGLTEKEELVAEDIFLSPSDDMDDNSDDEVPDYSNNLPPGVSQYELDRNFY